MGKMFFKRYFLDIKSDPYPEPDPQEPDPDLDPHQADADPHHC